MYLAQSCNDYVPTNLDLLRQNSRKYDRVMCMSKRLSGGCLCGAIQFDLEDNFSAFYQCHCKQCRQVTGSAFAANIFTRPNNINWVKGFDKITIYEHSEREFAKSFCQVCGSGVPFFDKKKTTLIVPAGSLDSEPSIEPQANIFVAEEACWFKPGLDAKRFESFPE